MKLTGKLENRAALMLQASMVGLMVSGSAHALDFDTGNTELSIRLGNTLRYNSGWRMRDPDPVLLANRNNDDGSASYDKGSQVTSRIDWLGELDVDYSRKFGARLSAAAWNDFAFHNDVRYNAVVSTGGSNYNGNVFSDRTKRYHKGLSGEFLDAYVYGRFDLGPAATEVRLGQQTVLWGEALILQPFSASDNQSPVDAIRAISTPGADAKEISLPVGQISLTSRIGSDLTLLAQYYYAHEASRAPQGGTYLGSADFAVDGPDKIFLGPFTLANRGVVKPKQSGDWGIGARWTPAALGGGTIGAYYRVYTDKSPLVSLNVAPGGSYQFFFPRDQKLFGLSLSQNFGGASVGLEVTRRENTLLNSTIQNGSLNAARGKAWTALANAMFLFGPNGVWSSATFIGEVGYSRLSQITENPGSFIQCTTVRNSNCSDAENVQVALRFAPAWTAVVPGWDAALNTAVTYVPDGNSPLTLPDHGYHHGGSYLLGTTWTYNTKHDFSLSYIGYLGDRTGTTLNGSQRQDRNWISFTYKASF